MQIVSNDKNLHVVSNPAFFLEKKNLLSYAEFANRAVKVKF